MFVGRKEELRNVKRQAPKHVIIIDEIVKLRPESEGAYNRIVIMHIRVYKKDIVFTRDLDP